MPQFITPDMLEPKESLCAHDITVPQVFQSDGDSVHRACWTLSSVCKKCGTIFIYDTQFGVFDDLYKGEFK